MSMTTLAKQVQRILEQHEEGLNINQITEILHTEVSPFLKEEKIVRSLKTNAEVFTESHPHFWRLKIFTEQEEIQAKVKRIIDSKSEQKEETTSSDVDETQKQYKNLRENYIDVLKKDLIGPQSEDEKLTQRPNTYYLGGMLYPSNVEVEDIDITEHQTENEKKKKSGQKYEKDYDSEENDGEVSNTNRFQPSSIGLTCNIDPKFEDVVVQIKYGKYKIDKDGKKKVYKRTQINHNESIPLKQKLQGSFFYEDNSVECRWIVRKKEDRVSLSVFLVNRYRSDENDTPVEYILFQPVIILKGKEKGAPPFIRRDTVDKNLIDDPDLDQTTMLYRNKADFAVGHGCAAEWENYNSKKADYIRTTFIPEYEVPAVEHLKLEEMTGLNMYVLAYIENMSQLKEQLNPLVNEFNKWINAQNQIELDKDFEGQRQKHINLCNKAAERIQEGINIVSGDKQAFKAFKFANEIMLYQRAFSMKSANYRKTGFHEDELLLEGKWRPFQLAFILLNIKSIVDPTCEERDFVDLLWFPTGGGKTEAYLGLASFVMALRRLRGVKEGIDGYAGTAILMRYTLRLLTIQQFQRASALICAAEYLRSKNPDQWGTESFSIGLWVGGGTTPNRFSGDESAKEALMKLEEGQKVYGPNPIQLHNCPCCGEALTHDCYNVDHDVMTIFCPNDKCHFHNNTIPAYTVDEAIYYKCPTILIGTVDKFARLPWNGNIAALFGNVDRYCERHGFIREGDNHPNTHNVTGTLPKSNTIDINYLLPPELIIQDEFHLISGPLGSMVGLYETAIDYLSINDKNYSLPKVVASTATIRRADKQVKGVFNREVRQFPPPSVDAEDSFFSYEVDSDKKPGRKYIGLSFPGSSGKTSLVRIYASLLQKGYDADAEGEDADPYWTLAGYFNSLRELGGALRLIEDDIPDRIKYLVKNNETKKRRFINKKEELTSRIDATEIPEILNKLEQPYNNKGSVDVLLSTNMISVGVDIDRLGLMVVAGQPKSTSEYIQATSRVGRKHPGLVITLYNWSRPRDISHYEQFVSYHSKFYAHVEASSVTPFSYRARDKALKAVVIGMLRQLDPDLSKNSGARNFTSDKYYLEDLKEHIINRCKAIDKIDNENIEEEIDDIFDWWKKRVIEKPDELSYQQFQFSRRDEPVLLKSINQEIPDAELIPDSLRDVEAEVDVFYTDLNDGEEE